MNLIKDIQNAAVDNNTDLATLLRKCKLLAAQLDMQPMQEWVTWESNGYPDSIPIPEYRIWSLEIKGHFAGPFGSGIKNAPIPLVCIPEKTRKQYEKYECRQSIASIEDILGKATKGRVQVGTKDLAILLGTKVVPPRNRNRWNPVVTI